MAIQGRVLGKNKTSIYTKTTLELWFGRWTNLFVLNLFRHIQYFMVIGAINLTFQIGSVELNQQFSRTHPLSACKGQTQSQTRTGIAGMLLVALV